jgi:hypothetical protein
VTSHGPDRVHAFRISDGVHLKTITMSCPVFAVADPASRNVYVSGWGDDDTLFVLRVSGCGAGAQHTLIVPPPHSASTVAVGR